MSVANVLIALALGGGLGTWITQARQSFFEGRRAAAWGQFLAAGITAAALVAEMAG